MNYYTKSIVDTTNSAELPFARERLVTSTIPNQYRYYHQQVVAEYPEQKGEHFFGNNIPTRIQYNTTHMMNKKIKHFPKLEQEKESLTVLSISPAQEEDENPSIPKICSKGGVKAPFPVKLMDLLNIVDEHTFDYDGGTSLQSIISWQPDGKCFRVHDKVLFEKHVQHRCFEQTNYSSFRRQLNLWGFKRIAGPKTGPNFGAYYHPQFTRDDKYNCRLMRRPSSRIKNSKKQQTKKSSSVSVSRSNSKKSCKYPRSHSECVVSPHSPTAVDHDMHMRLSLPPSSNNYGRKTNSYSSSSSTSNFNFSSPPRPISAEKPSRMVTSIEEAYSYVQKWDEEMTAASADSSNSTTAKDSTEFHDSFDEKIVRSLLFEDKCKKSREAMEEELFELPDCEPIQEEDIYADSMEISLSSSEEIAYLLQTIS